MTGNADLAEPCPQCHCLVLPIDKLPHDEWHATVRTQAPPVAEAPPGAPSMFKW